jgi:hypothetical protein
MVFFAFFATWREKKTCNTIIPTMTLESVRTIFKTQSEKPPTRWQKGFIAVYLGVALTGMIAETVYFIRYNHLAPLFLWVGIPYLLLGLWFIRDLSNERTCARLMLSALDKGCNDLAWVYIEKTSGAYESTALHYRFTNRRHGSLITDDQTASDLLAFFARNYSQLSAGFTPELEKQFRRSPVSLKTNPVRSSAEKHTVIQSDNASNGW